MNDEVKTNHLPLIVHPSSFIVFLDSAGRTFQHTRPLARTFQQKSDLMDSVETTQPQRLERGLGLISAESIKIHFFD